MNPASFSDPISQVISQLPYCPEDDREKVRDLFVRFPKVLAGYQEFLSVEPVRRIPLAAHKLEHTPRSGWLRFDLEIRFRDILNTHLGEYYGSRCLLMELTKTSESVLEHSAEAQELFSWVFQEYQFKQWGAEVMKFHDFVEAINGDFTPLDQITKPEKTFLEKIALQLLTENRSNGDLLAAHIYNAMRIFEGETGSFLEIRQEMLLTIEGQLLAGNILPRQRTFVDFLKRLYNQEEIDLGDLKSKATEIDALQMLIAGRRIMHEKTYGITLEKAQQEWQGFVDYVDRKLVSREAQAFFKVFIQHSSADVDTPNLLLRVLSEFSAI